MMQTVCVLLLIVISHFLGALSGTRYNRGELFIHFCVVSVCQPHVQALYLCMRTRRPLNSYLQNLVVREPGQIDHMSDIEGRKKLERT